LPVDWRLVVVLADVEELTYREIADVMGVPVGTVMSRLHRARQRLRQQLLDTPRATWTHDERSA
jgi:RNA polymerase sigma-70 factor (ECF subfamily)